MNQLLTKAFLALSNTSLPTLLLLLGCSGETTGDPNLDETGLNSTGGTSFVDTTAGDGSSQGGTATTNTATSQGGSATGGSATISASGGATSPTNSGGASPDVTAGNAGSNTVNGNGTGGGATTSTDSSDTVDCSAIEARGWELCDSGPDFCAAVFRDSAGCSEVCAAVGLTCAEAWEDIDGQCAADETLPSLSCSTNSGHQADYCLCTDSDGPVNPGDGTGGASGGGGGAPALGGAFGSGGNESGGNTAGGNESGGAAVGGSTSDPGNDECPATLQGWAAESGDGVDNTTGGGDATPQRVTSAQELGNLAGDNTARVIEIEGSLNVPNLQIGSNKTLVGVGADATVNGGIDVRGSNVILRNLHVNGASAGGGYDAVVLSGAHHVWIDHCDLYDGPDGTLDITNGSNWVTISWTIIRYTNNWRAAPGETSANHRYASLVGNGDDNTGDRGRLKVTFHHNWWSDGVVERMPRVRFGQVHAYNNYFASPGNNYCIRAGFEAHILSESNYFDGVSDAHEFNNGSDQNSAHITARNNEYDGVSGAQDPPEGGGTPFDNAPYSANIDPATSIPDLVTRCAGPR